MLKLLKHFALVDQENTSGEWMMNIRVLIVGFFKSHAIGSSGPDHAKDHIIRLAPSESPSFVYLDLMQVDQ